LQLFVDHHNRATLKMQTYLEGQWLSGSGFRMAPTPTPRDYVGCLFSGSQPCRIRISHKLLGPCLRNMGFWVGYIL